MRPRTLVALFCLLAGAFCLPPSGAWAQPPKLRIDQVRIGFPAGRGGETRFKSGAWAPVFVDVMAPKGLLPGDAVMVVETSDSDNVQNRFRTAVPGLEPEKLTTLLTYVRPGNLDADRTTVTIYEAKKDAAGRDTEGRTLDSAKPGRLSQNALTPDTVLYLVAGSQLPSLMKAILPKEQDPDDDTGPRRFAFAQRIEHLPTRWFGYQSADLMVLTTGNDTFTTALLGDQSQRKEALVEWVRRGGRLVISVGHNNQPVNKLLAQMKLIDCEVRGSVYRKNLTLKGWVGQQPLANLPGAGIEVAVLAPGKGVEVLASEADFQGGPNEKRDLENRPLIVQAPCGLGRVMLIAFDLDQAPFTGSAAQTEFYQRLNREMEPRPGTVQVGPRQPGMAQFGFDGRSAELAATLQDGLESFEDIPVVSFGWVALFIFLYILVVGPLDYLFLKKVVKRLELTWITFPVVVLIVSALAYFTAYYLKGNDLKINKVDLVDIDLHRSRVYGHTWFTLFSPRIQNYTVGVEPAHPTWAPPPGDAGYSTLVGWMGRPEDRFGGSGRSGGQSLFKRAYTYEPNAAGLEGVPIQVWATKSFNASWEADMSAGKALFSSTLHHPVGKPEEVVGQITSHLPVELHDVVVLYGGQVYRVDRLSPGVPWQPFAAGGGGRTMDQWLNQDQLSDPYHRIQRQDRWGGPVAAGDSTLGQLMKTVLFYRKVAPSRSGLDNAELRPLDQSWRIPEGHDPVAAKRKHEVILFGRTAPNPAGAAETVTLDGVSPSRLWLGKIPSPQEKQRPGLAGTLLQRTHVRVFIPVETK